MAIVLEANYQKRLGLPNYSSHAYSVTVRTEVGDLKEVEAASSRLYHQLQEAVDRDIRQTGFLPGNESSPEPPRREPERNGGWNCSSRQQGLIEKLMSEHGMGYPAVDALARERFGSGLKSLNKMQASGLIDELIDSHSGARRGRGQRGGAR